MLYVYVSTEHFTMSDNENEHDNEVVINVDRRLERLELAQQAASNRAKKMLDRVCQQMQEGYKRIRTDMAQAIYL